jgi:hypothetical protein
VDRADVAQHVLQELQRERLRLASVGASKTSSTLLSGLEDRLDERLDRIRLVRGLAEAHLPLLAEATHVYMFDCGFHPQLHALLVPLLYAGPPRIVITSLTHNRMRNVWLQHGGAAAPSLSNLRHAFHLLQSFSVTLAGSQSSRTLYAYQTRASGP